MSRRITFFCAVVPIVLALQFAPALATPIHAAIGNARVSVVASPDPPRVGVTTFTVSVSGLSPERLSRIKIAYHTSMPSMNMAGPSGLAVRVPGRSGAWRFAVHFVAATTWTLRVNLSGGLVGSVLTNLSVTSPTTSMTGMPAPTATTKAAKNTADSAGSSSAMAGMGASSEGDSSAWRNAALALFVTIAIGTFMLGRERRTLTIGMVFVAGLVILGIAFAQSKNAASSDAMASMDDTRGLAPIPVTFATISRARNGPLIAAPAEVEPYLVQDIVARTSGVLTDFQVYTGNQLRAGEVIARLSEPELQIDAREAEAAGQAARNQRVAAQEDATATRADLSAKRENLRYWNAEIARERMLLHAGAVSVQEYQSERAQVSAARASYTATLAKVAGANAEVDAARAEVMRATANARARSVLAGYTRVIAPNAAVVMRRLVDPGVFVEPGTPILKVAVINRLRVRAQIAQQNLTGIRMGTPIDIFFGGGEVLHARVTSLSPVVERSTHTAIAEAIVPNPGDRYQPGGFVHVVLHPSVVVHNKAFTVPSAAIVGGATTAIWIDEHGTAKRVSVILISDDGTVAHVSGHLRTGMRVVVTGAAGLEEGQAVVSAGP